MSKTLKELESYNFSVCEDENGKIWYVLREDAVYTSHRYKKTATARKGFPSNGASGPAEDVVSKAWFIHDWLRTMFKWDDGTECTNLQASFVLHDILMKENRWFRARTWFVATLGWGWIVDVFRKDKPTPPTNKIDPTGLPIAFA